MTSVPLWRVRAVAALRELRARPWHTGTAALVAGLLLGPRAPLAVPLAALAAPVLGSRAAVRLALAGAVVTGALVAQARLEAIDATHLAPRIGHAVRERVLLLDAPRARPFGVRVATVRLDGERVLLRAGRGVRWPTERIGAILDGTRRPRAAARVGCLAARTRRARPAARGCAGRHRSQARGARGAGRRRAGAGPGRPAQGVPPPEAALLRGMALGDDAALPDRTRGEFRASGLSHLVAASRAERDAARRPRPGGRGGARASRCARGSRWCSAPSRSTCRWLAAGRRSSERG